MLLGNTEDICSCEYRYRNTDTDFYVIMTLVFFNNLRLTWVFISIENNQFKLVAIHLNSWKNTKSFGNRLFTLSVAVFLC